MFRGGRLLVAVVFVLALSVTTANAAVRAVGTTTSFDAPECKDDNCRIFTRTTAFQLKSSMRPGLKNISRVPRDGKLIAWSLALPKVTGKRNGVSFIAQFNDSYAGGSSARIAVLRRTPRKGQTYYRYKLVAQTPKVSLRTYFGSHPTFALDSPLSVKRNDVIAITSDTWIPAFTARQEDAGSTWRASRPAGKCSGNEDDDWINYKLPFMHRVVNQIKRYSCPYSGSRILYNATIVDTPKKTKGYK
jgi:hypothetical protein